MTVKLKPASLLYTHIGGFRKPFPEKELENELKVDMPASWKRK